MPTGYTVDLYAGKPTTFEEFTLTAARAMGAAIMQRDDGPGPIKADNEPSRYHKAGREAAIATLAELANVSLDEWARREGEYRTARLRRDREADAKVAAIRARYEAMLAQVEAWQPPTAEHEGLKKFMREQLEQSIESDCTIYPRPERVVTSAVEFKEAALKSAAHDVDYHTKKMREDEDRAASRNKWVRDIRASLTN